MNLNSKKPEKRPLYVYYIIAVVIIVLLNVFALPALSERSVKETDYTTFLKAVDRGKVYEATINSDYIYYTMKVDGNDVYCKTVSVEDQDLVSHLYDAGVSIEGTAPQRQSLLLSLILGYVLPIAIFILLGRWLSKKMMSSMGNGGPGGMMSFGKSNAKVYVKSSTGIKFSDVAGEDEAKELLTEIVDFLHNPEKYREIGASMPKGALLVGPPEPVKLFLPRQLPVRRRFRFSQFPVRNLWRCLWVWVLPRSVIFLNRPMRRHHVSYLLMRSIPSARNVTAPEWAAETMSVSRH